MYKSELSLNSRSHEVNMSNLVENAANISLSEPNACLTLPMKKKRVCWIFTKNVQPKGEFSYEIVLTGDQYRNDENRDEILTREHFSEVPISCKINGCSRGSSGHFKVEACKSEVLLFFDSSKLIDCPCTIDRDRTFTLPFKIVVKGASSDQSGKDFVAEDYLEVTVKKFTPRLTFKFQGPSSTEKIVYTATGMKEVGRLTVSHIASFSCAPDVSDATFSMNSVLETEGSEVKKDDRLFLKIGDNYCTTVDGIHLKADESKEFSVVLDMSNVNNPHSTETPDRYDIELAYNQTTPRLEGFYLYRNPILVRGKVEFGMPSNSANLVYHDISLANGEDLGSLRLQQNAEAQSKMVLRFQNTADAVDQRFPRASVLVWDVSIESVICNDSARIKTRQGVSLEDIFKLEKPDDRDSWVLCNRYGSSREFTITISAGDIESIMPAAGADSTFVELTLELKYHLMEDERGEYFDQVYSGHTDELADKAVHTCVLHLRLEKDPIPEWLCVDFGTSAVVAAYAQMAMGDDHGGLKGQVDLKKMKGHLLENVYGQGDPRNYIDDEEGNMISSTVCFNQENEGDFRATSMELADYANYAVWFSPSATNIRHDYLLPCLKTIIGYNYLPNIFLQEKMVGFEYNEDGETRRLVDENNNPTSLMKVDEVAQIVYRQLFEYYLSHEFNNHELKPRSVNKLVLSVPNTYTPLNIKAVKTLALSSIPAIYPEHLFTISESDAVACYYVYRENEFLDSVENEDRKNQLKNRESVLVYDMGAGTLDLTWFVKERTGDNRIVTIKGKLGVNKAGNYLDYELASILNDLYQKKIGKNSQSDLLSNALLLDRQAAIDNIVGTSERLELKNYIKEVKKQLGHPEKWLPKLKLKSQDFIKKHQNGRQNNGAGVSLQMKDILEHEHFGEIINEITEKVLVNFGQRYGDGEGKLDIDVLIFSGRSTCLQAIREGVREHIGKICRNPEKLLYADISASKLSNDIAYEQENNNGNLKSVVTQGALAFASMFSSNGRYQLKSNPFYASYGLVLYNNDRSYTYVPLIGDNAPIKEEDGKIKGECEVDPQDLLKIDLIQSYSSDVVADYENRNFDTISKLCDIPCQGRPPFTATLEINILKKNAMGTGMEFKVAQATIPLNPHDDFNNLSLRKSLWPVIFDNRENR